MYYSDDNPLKFNSSIWGTDNSFFPRASEKTKQEAEDLMVDISYLGSSSSEDINTNEMRTENTATQGPSTSDTQSQNIPGTLGSTGQDSSFMGGGSLGMYPTNQGIPFNMTTSATQNFNTSTNPLYGTYFMGQNAPSMGSFTEGLSPSNPTAQSSIGAAMHPSMYGWTHYCIPHMPAYPVPTFVNPMLQGPMGTMGAGQMGSQFSGGVPLQYPMTTYPDISSTGAYNLTGTMGPQINPWMNSMAIFPFTPYTGGMGPLMIQPGNLQDMDDQDNMYSSSMNRSSKSRDRRRKKHNKHCFYYNAFSNYPYYSPVNFPMHHHTPDNCGCLWLHPFLLNLDMD
ncbi:hypothetical protein ACPWSR_10455 [Alloiococcus sp. CFN-8]|uniref:hypothetical protein n=1 Tax=Alloiococcus sp. CFN-8 TaxID=3416081 RepID=UPI003CF11439